MFKPDEFIPEYTSYLAATSRIQNSNNIPATTNIPGSMQFIHELATSQDPEIQRAFNEIVELYFEIIEESRLSTPAERKGNNNPDVIEERLKYDNYHFDKNADDPTYTAGANLMYSDIEGIYDFFEQDYAKLCRLYYEYKNNILTNDNAKRIFTELESSNNENWAIIKRHFENALESINAE